MEEYLKQCSNLYIKLIVMKKLLYQIYSYHDIKTSIKL